MKRDFGSLDASSWRFIDPAGEQRPRRNAWRSSGENPATTPESDAMSKDFKSRGFRFVGSTIRAAYMQAVGMVNDHARGCFLCPDRG